MVSLVSHYKVKTTLVTLFYSLSSIHCNQVTLLNASRHCLPVWSVRISTPLFVILVTLLLAFTCIDFRSIIFPQGIFLVATAFHAPRTTLSGLLQNIYWVIRAKACGSKSGSGSSKLGGKMFPLRPSLFDGL